MAQVDVYWSRVTPAAVSAFASHLSPSEQHRMERFHFDRDRAAYATAHGLLRQVLGPSPREPYRGNFIPGPQGKPGLPPGGMQFNLSHAHDLVAVAVSPDAPVGIDVEALSRPIDARALAPGVLSPPEVDALVGAGWPSRDFLALWVMKEAIAKAAGEGLHADFRRISVGRDPLRIVDLPPGFGKTTDWSTDSLVVEDHCIAVAVHHRRAQVQWRAV